MINSLNTVVATVALEMLNKNDSSLYDAIVDRDGSLINWLVMNKYRLEIVNRGYIKERMNIARMIEAVEEMLDKKKIRLNC